MTFDELIKKYHNRIIVAKDKKAVTATIIEEINRLTSSENDRPISNEDKRRLLTSLQSKLLNEAFLLHFQDNKEYLELINQAFKMLGGK